MVRPRRADLVAVLQVTMLLPLLVKVALAHDPPPVESGFVADIGVQVEMPPVVVHGSILGTGIWSGVPDAMALEIALTAHNIPTEDASLVSAAPTVDADGTSHVRLAWVDLGDGTERFAVQRRGTGRVCTAKTVGGFWEGGHEVLVYAPSSAWAAENLSTPAFVLIDDNPRVGALVSLAPGETLTVRDLRREGLLWRELVTVSRKKGSLVLDRQDGVEQLCFEAPQAP
jgi:hypothetical protein